MKRLGTIATTVALACRIGSAFASDPTGARPVYNVNDPVNHPYVQNYGNGQCTSNTDCIVTFQAATAPVTLVQHISCVYQLSGNATTVYANAVNYSTFQENQLPVFSFGSGSNYRGINESTYLFLKSGESLQVAVRQNGGAVQDLQCNISGYHN